MDRSRKPAGDSLTANSVVADPPVITSEGQRLLLATTGSHAEVAAKLGTSRQSVHQWRSGEKRPGPTMRAKVHEAFGIPGDTWGLHPASPEASPGTGGELASPEPALVAPRGGRVGEIDALIELTRRQRDGQKLLPRELQASVETEMRLLELRQKAETAVELQETRIVTGHPFWRRLRGAICDALKAHPDAMRDVVAKLEQLGA